VEQYYASGQVSQFSGTTGLLRTILNQIVGSEVVNEVLDATADGVRTSFAGTLAHAPCGLGRLVVRYTVGGMSYTATDNGAGQISGTHLAAGTLTYTTGAWSLSFAAAPSAGSVIAADYLYGAPGRDWRVLLDRNTRASTGSEPFGSECKEVVLQNTGLSGCENVVIGLREWRYTTGSAWGLDLNGYTYYNAGMDWNGNSAQHGRTSYSTTWGHWDQLPVLPLINTTMYYWLYSNRQRLVVVVKVQSNHESMYLGFGRRFGSPNDYPCPLVVKASCQGNYNYSSAASWRQFVANNEWTQYGYTLLAVDPANSYIVCGGASDYDNGLRVLPYNQFDATAGTLTSTPTLARSLMSPVYLARPLTDTLLMDLDGVFHVASNAVLTEDVLVADGVRHRVFNNIWRNAYYDYLAVAEADA
jgi:hypothetical protein